jgi:hypothetical protein
MSAFLYRKQVAVLETKGQPTLSVELLRLCCLVVFRCAELQQITQELPYNEVTETGTQLQHFAEAASQPRVAGHWPQRPVGTLLASRALLTRAAALACFHLQFLRSLSSWLPPSVTLA